MTLSYIQINEADLVPLVNVKRIIGRITEDERSSLAGLGEHVQPHKFNTRLDFSDRSKSYAPETLDDFARQGVDLVEIDEDIYIPGQNIIRARNLTGKDREDMEAKYGRSLREDFKAQVETKAGTVLATVTADTVMHRMGHPYQPAQSEAEEPQMQ